jgi:hypothetical protein
MGHEVDFLLLRNGSRADSSLTSRTALRPQWRTSGCHRRKGERIGRLPHQRVREVKRALGYELDWSELKVL